MSEGFWPNFDQINISHRRPCSVWIVNLLTWQKPLEGGYDEKSWEMAYNWLIMTSSGDDNSRVGVWVCSPTKLKKKNKNKPKAEQETAQPTAARFNNKTFNKRKNRALLTLACSQKHYEICSNNVSRKHITRKQFKRWLGLVSISQTALGYLVMLTQSKYWL